MSIKEIFDAIEHGNAVDLGRLIAAGGNINEVFKDPMNCTFLEYAAVKDSLDCVKLLISAGADINARNDSGNTPLMMACINGSISVVHYLIHAGAKLDCKNDVGFTAIMFAAKAGNYYCLVPLVEAGADLLARNDKRKTAFEEAIDAEGSNNNKAIGAEHRACIEYLSEKMEGVPKLVTLLYAIGAPFLNTREIFNEIEYEFEKAVTSEERSRLLNTLVNVMNIVLPTIPVDKVEEIKESNRKIYHSYIVQESVIGGNVCIETLYQVTSREIEAGRMTEHNNLRKIAIDGMAELRNARAELVTMRDGTDIQPQEQPHKKSIWRKLLSR